MAVILGIYIIGTIEFKCVDCSAQKRSLNSLAGRNNLKKGRGYPLPFIFFYSHFTTAIPRAVLTNHTGALKVSSYSFACSSVRLSKCSLSHGSAQIKKVPAMIYSTILKYLYTVGLLSPDILASSEMFSDPEAYAG